MMKIYFLLLIFLIEVSCSKVSRISTEPVKLSFQNMISSTNNVFELGFFKPAHSSGVVNRWYVGIWHRMLRSEQIWVANRKQPLSKPVGTLKVFNSRLHLYDESNMSVWSSTNLLSTNLKSPLLGELLDDGNLVLRYEKNNDSAGFLWQSFNDQTDTLLSHMNLGWDAETDRKRFLESWSGLDDPSPGRYTCEVEQYHGIPEMLIMEGDYLLEFRTDLYNNKKVVGNSMYVTNNLTMSEDGATYSFRITNHSLFSILRLSHMGELKRSTLIKTKHEPKLLEYYIVKYPCDIYNWCGPNSLCDEKTTPLCSKIQIFMPEDPTGGNCRGYGFKKLENLILPDSRMSDLYTDIGIKECEDKCLRNCSCIAYANIDTQKQNGGSDCIIWLRELVDLRRNPLSSQHIYVKMAASTTLIGEKGSRNLKMILVIVGVGIVLLLSCIVIGFWKLNKRRRKKRHARAILPPIETADLQLGQMELKTVATATQNFSDSNKIGQGGYGAVYKGMLLDGQAIAVKRLVKRSTEGIEGVYNEVRLIASVQHINLVKLIGYCFEDDERILIYEYLENSSLNKYIFDKTVSYKLNWDTRFSITNGIARGLLYLHHDSRVPIIHLDLKPSNVLLDKDMVPKISDFGMAKLFGRDETDEANTTSRAGTYGYMSPEYSIDGIYSIKSDVFSFGVLVLEIISGIKNIEFYHSNYEEDLLSYIWKNWDEGKGLEVVDPVIRESIKAPVEVLRCIQIGLLCVQERAEDRPTMSAVVTMLTSDRTEINQPKPPGYFVKRCRSDVASSSQIQQDSRTCESNFSSIVGR